MDNRTDIVEVAVPRPMRRTFDYAAPAGEPVPMPGTRVRVPLGRVSVVGLVTGGRRMPRQESAPGTGEAAARRPPPRKLKTIEQVLDDEPLLSADLMELAQWLARYYHHPIGDVCAAMLPAKARRGAPAATIDEIVWRMADGAIAQDALSRAPKQRQALEQLRRLGEAADAELTALNIDRRALLALRDKGLATRIASAPRCRPPREKADLELTPAQAAAIHAITASLGTPAIHLLEGVTGSGKTEVYLRIIADVLRSGRQALVLVPEIALTPQTLERFKARFGTAATLHSGMTDGQRFDVWLKCANGTHKVLVGTRSAVLAPFADLGVIVVDEEHDGSFKQGEGLRYSARDVATKRGRMLSVPVVLGSATPSLESLENVRRQRYRHAHLAQRAGGASMPAYRIVDLRGAALDRGFSQPVHAAIARHLDAGSQVLVFVNRRGLAPVLLCAKCAWQAQCDHCDAKLTVHRAPSQLRCHQCDRRRPLPTRCPSCAGDGLIRLGTGTQRAEEVLAERYPDTPLYRIDRDTVRSSRRLEADLAAIRSGSPTILVGTQMLAKGHHLPGVALVVVLNADAGLLAADFRAPERTAQLIVQVAGRAGRAERPGEVLIQTFNPDNPNLAALLHSGYRGFVANERRLREAAQMPPFASLAIVRAESKVEAAAAGLLAGAVAILGEDGVEVLGPAPAPVARRDDRYRCQLLVLARRRAHLHRALDQLERAAPQAARRSLEHRCRPTRRLLIHSRGRV